MIPRMFEKLFPGPQRARVDEAARWVIDEKAGAYLVGGLVIRRADVVEITAWKLDLVTVDSICLGLKFGSPDEKGDLPMVRIAEEEPEYEEIVEDLAKHFGLREGWWNEVAFPAFEENKLVLWSRAQACTLPGSETPVRAP